MGILEKYRKFLWVLAAVSVIILMLFYNALLPIKKLPVYQPAMVNFELVDSTIQHHKKFHRIADFSLTNQNGKTVTQKDFKGKIDSVPQLKKYAIEKGVIDKKWNLVTGDKKEIYDLARKSYLAVKEDGDGGPFDMIHTENFILVDPDRRIRGFYDGTDLEEIQRLLEELEILIQEYFPH